LGERKYVFRRKQKKKNISQLTEKNFLAAILKEKIFEKKKFWQPF